MNRLIQLAQISAAAAILYYGGAVLYRDAEVRRQALVWLAPVAAICFLLASTISVGYAGTVMRFAVFLRAAGALVGRGWSSVIRALERHAEERHARHCAAWFREAAE